MPTQTSRTFPRGETSAVYAARGRVGEILNERDCRQREAQTMNGRYGKGVMVTKTHLRSTRMRPFGPFPPASSPGCWITDGERR
jgi:hypothetical protein